MARVLVIQDYVPKYREPLFAAIRAELAESGDDLKIVCGEPQGHLSARGDRASHGFDVVPSREVKIPGLGKLRAHRVGSYVKAADLIVGELATLNATTWELITKKQAAPVILWGHGGSFVQKGSLLRASIESLVARNVAHIMTYTSAGKRMLVNNGIPPQKVTAIGNSTNTVPLREEILRGDVRRKPHHFFYVGGLDESKRIPFLLAAAKYAATISEDFKLTVFGRGEMEAEVQAAAEGVEYLTYAGSAGKAELVTAARSCSGVWMPGRVGLVAADCLALGLPVFTTDYNYHAPEIEFLAEGESLITLSGSSEEFARECLALSGKRSMLLPQWSFPTVQGVAQKFSRVVRETLATK